MNAAPTPLLWSLQTLISLTILLIFMGGGWSWWQLCEQLARGEAPLPFTPRRTVPWGLLDILVGMMLWVLLGVGTVLLLKQVAGIDLALDLPETKRDDFDRSLLDSLARVAAVLLIATLIAKRTGCESFDLGWSPRHVIGDVLLGVRAFVTLALPVFALQLILTKVWPSQHPLIEALKAEQEPRMLAQAFIMAVICAPIAEEFLFRVLFQGWLEKLFDPQAMQRANYGENVLWGEHALAEKDATNSEPVYAAFAPIFISALVFALLHFSHGPDWIPLLILSLGLGYLYRRTHRVLPGLIVHFLLNLLSMLSLCVQLHSP